MNKQLQKFARDTIKKGLSQLPAGNQTVFKRMYANNNIDMSINEVVDKMPEDKLDWAMQQVERSINNK